MKIKDLQALLREKLSKHLAYYKDNGLWNTIPYILIRLNVIFKIRAFKEFFYKKREFIFFELNISEKNYNVENCNIDDLYQVKPEEIESEDRYFDGWFKKKAALKRLKKGYILRVKKIKDKKIYYQWLEVKNAYIPPLDLTFVLPNNTVYKSYVYTSPEFRGKQIAVKAKLRTLKYLQECGYENILFVVASENVPAIGLGKYDGSKEYQIVNYRKWLFVKYYCVKDWDSDFKRIFWRIFRKDKTIWKTFSKIQ